MDCGESCGSLEEESNGLAGIKEHNQGLNIFWTKRSVPVTNIMKGDSSIIFGKREILFKKYNVP